MKPVVGVAAAVAAAAVEVVGIRHSAVARVQSDGCLRSYAQSSCYSGGREIVLMFDRRRRTVAQVAVAVYAASNLVQWDTHPRVTPCISGLPRSVGVRTVPAGALGSDNTCRRRVILPPLDYLGPMGAVGPTDSARCSLSLGVAGSVPELRLADV